MEAPVLYLILPCCNEEPVLPETAARLEKLANEMAAAGEISAESRVCFVDDGSKDATWRIVSSLHEKNPLFCGIRLSRNRGHQNALLAGLLTCRPLCDCAISLDADLQDDLGAIGEMVKKFREGCQIVYGVRRERKADTPFKRLTAQGFYKILAALGGEIVYNHADYRLLSRRALDELAKFGEVNLFLRGIVPMLGFKTGEVLYDRAERFAGESKYPLKKMLAFAWEGVTSLSTKPIKMISALGGAIFAASLAMLAWSLVRHFSGRTTLGWSSLMTSIWALGGLQLLAIGVIGEYVGKIYLESKARPRFIVEEFLR